MNKLVLMLLLFGFNISSIYGQVIDFNRIGNQMIPVFRKEMLPFGTTRLPGRPTNAGILIQEAQWLDVKTKYSSDLLIYFTDKNQYFSLLYSSPSFRQTEIKLEYFKKISPAIMIGAQLGNIQVDFRENQNQNIIMTGINGVFKPHINHQIYGKYEKKFNSGDLLTKNAYLIGAESIINPFLTLNLFFIHNIGNRSNGFSANIKGNYLLFVGEIGWEPLPYSITGGLAYNLPKNCKFGLSIRHHQWLGLLSAIYFQKQWNFNKK